MKRDQNVPMFLADACLVRMSELIAGSSVLTLDSDFRSLFSLAFLLPKTV